jgi:hypothetical protein
MAKFRVQPDELRRTVDGAEEAATILDDVGRGTADLARRMQGDPALDRAVGGHHIGEFSERWTKEFQLVKDMVLSMNELIELAAQSYDDMDVALADQLTALTPAAPDRAHASADSIDRPTP